MNTRVGWKGEVFSWNGLSFKSFWYQNRNSYFTIKSHLTAKLDIGKAYKYVYVLCDNTDIESYQSGYLRLIGGQSHVQSQEHKLQLIVSFALK